MMTPRQAIFFVLLVFTSSVCLGQDQVDFKLSGPEETVRAGDSFNAVLNAEIEEGWHLYSMELPEGGPIPTRIRVQEDEVFSEGGPVQEPEPIPWFDQNFGMETNYFEDEVDFQIPVKVKPSALGGDHSLSVEVRFMICTESLCLPPQTKKVSTLVSVQSAADTSDQEPAPDRESTAPPPPEAEPGDEENLTGSVAATPAQSLAEEQESLPVPETNLEAAGVVEEAGGIPAGLLAYIWFAMTMGALALLTPCVFPMIPITVSYFTKRESTSHRKAVWEAGLYSIGIILTFTLLGFGLTFLLGAGGINRLAASPTVNILIAAVFVLFALSLFGVVELRLPNSWLNAINRKSSQTTGVLGILLMALTFSLTSFTCTVPFIGTVMLAALQGDLLWSMVGVTAFAAVFSLPFFLLALFPTWLQSLPKSGSWMNSIKITMGFLELAAALKFISNVDLVYQWEFITRPVFITVWLAIGLITTVYLLGWFRFPHEMSTETIGAGRVFSAVFFLAISFYLLRGLFGFPLGELDAFLPPRDYGETGTIASLAPQPGGRKVERWLSSYDEALEEARATARPIFIDFTGYTCTNCRWMESNIFPLSEVQELFDEMVLVRLYTDGNEPAHAQNQQFEKERFGTIALPYYAIMSPQDKVLATFPGLTRDRSEFVSFLKKGLESAGDSLVSLSR